MQDPSTETEAKSEAAEHLVCAECQLTIRPDEDREVTDAGTFCRSCFNLLASQVRQVVAAQGEDINYFLAALGGLAGGALGAGVWWGFTVSTDIAFGLVAIVIGIAVGKGVVIASGGKRAQSLQIISAIISTVSFFLASYWVNRSFINDSPEFVAQGVTLPLLPDPLLAYEIVALSFDFMDLVFLAIVLWEAWRIPSPMQLES